MSARLRTMARGPMAVVVLGLVLLAVLAAQVVGGGGDAPTPEPIPLSDPLAMPGLGPDAGSGDPGMIGDPGLIGDPAATTTTTTTTTTTLPPVERRNPFLPPTG
jgi:hypothetical protein